MPTVELTTENFEQTVLGDGIVIVDFWADWCGPCKMFAPVFEKSADANPDVVNGKLDTEAHQQLASALEIQAIPTLMVFRDGIGLFRQAGAPGTEHVPGVLRIGDRHALTGPYAVPPEQAAALRAAGRTRA